MSDPASHNDTQRMEIMMTKEYAHEIYTNITDVSCTSNFVLLSDLTFPTRTRLIPRNTTTPNMV